MKHIKFIILLVMFVSILITGYAFAASEAQWKVVVPKTLFAEKLRIAAFLNKDFGLTGGAGDIGKADHTTDGGKSWFTADSSGG